MKNYCYYCGTDIDGDGQVCAECGAGIAAQHGLEPDEVAVFAALDTAEGAYHFAAIMELTGLEHKRIRRACRSLARKQLAKYCRGLFNESDGQPYGSGYARVITNAH